MYQDTFFFASFAEKTTLSPLNCIFTFVENQLTVYVLICFRAPFCSVDLCVCLSPIPHGLDQFAFIVSLKIKLHESSTSVLLKNCFSDFSSFDFSYA